MGLFNWLFKKAAHAVFKKVDYNKDGKLEALEVEIAILHLYNKINKRLPGWQDPPTRAAINASFKQYDADGNNHLDEDEFVEFAGTLIRAGPDMFFSRVGKSAVVQSAVLPSTALAVQKVVGQFWQPVNNTPLSVLAPLIGSVFNSIKALVPL